MSNPSSTVAYGVPVHADRPFDVPLTAGFAVFDPVSLEEAQAPAELAGLQSRPVQSAHASDMMIQTDGAFHANVRGQRWALHVGREISFHWIHGAGKIQYEVHEPSAADDFTYWSLHLVLPMYLALEGVVQLVHGGCVTHEAGAVLFLAPSFGGKSTLVNTFLERGHRLVSDDKLPLIRRPDGWYAIPSHPMHRPWRGRRDMGRPAPAVASEPVRLTAVYVLAVEEQAQATTITPLKGQLAVAQLLRSHLFQLRFLRARGLEFLSELARSLPIYALRTPRDLDRLPVLHEEIMAHLTAVSERLLGERPDGPGAGP